MRTSNTSRFNMIRDNSLPREQRVFAALELVLFPVSVATLGAMVALGVLSRCGVKIPAGLAVVVMPILVAGAIGFLTNRIAIEMLFKPYLPSKFHPLSMATFGYWRQGLVPKNKDRIAEVVGRETEEKLLSSEKMSADICDAACSALRDPELGTSLKTAMKAGIERQGDKIATAVSTAVKASFHKQIAEKFGAMSLMLIPIGDSVIDASVTAENTERTLKSLLDSPDMAKVVWGFLPEVEKMIRERGVGEIAGKLRIAERITTAVREMNVEEFHGVVDNVAAQHLGAIQVLGYFLGAIAGATMLLF